MISENINSPLILDGRILSAKLRMSLGQKVDQLRGKGCQPGLSVILLGEDPASKIYVNQKEKACGQIGINSHSWRLPASANQAELLSLIDELNDREDVHGILVQMPLPEQIDPLTVIEAIKPEKDVDGFHPVNMGRLLAGEKCFISCTPHGILKLLQDNNIPLNGKEAVIIGRSNIVGKPLAILLLQQNATVTICHSRTVDLPSHTRRADILVAAVGKPGLVTSSMVKEGAVVIDVGQNRTEEGKLIGDVDYQGVAPKASAITPVPGGVGPMTITMLLFNTLLSAEEKMGINSE